MQALWMLVASFIFAVMGVCVKIASGTFSTSELVMYRGVIGIAILACVMRRQRVSFRTSMPLAHVWRCLVGVVSMWMWFFALAKLPLATAMTLNYMSPIWMALILFLAGWWHAKNHVEWPLIAAVALSFVGVVLLLQPVFAADLLGSALIALGSSVLSALAYLQVRKLGQAGEPTIRVVFYFSVANLLAGILGNLLFTDHGHVVWHPVDNWPTALLLGGIGLCATCAQLAMTLAYNSGKTLVVANLQYSGIVFSSMWGVLIFGDVFSWHSWAGIAIILLSGSAATFYNTRRTERGTAIAVTDPIASEA